VLISTHKFFLLFSLPCPAEEGSDRVALVSTWCPGRINPPQQFKQIPTKSADFNESKDRMFTNEFIIHRNCLVGYFFPPPHPCCCSGWEVGNSTAAGSLVSRFQKETCKKRAM